MTNTKILKRIRNLQKLTPSEFRLVDFLSHNASQAMFENVTSLADKTRVSKATVVRFIAKLGYESFKDFRRELLEDARGIIESLPKLYRMKKQELESTSDDILDRNITSVIHDLELAKATINRETFNRAAEIIHEKKGNLYACGFRTSHALAQMFHIMIKRIHPNSFLIGPQIAMMPDMLLDVTAEDVLVAVFRYPFARQTVQIAKCFLAAGARILLITDSELSPLADQATIQIVVTSEGSSISRSFTAITAVLEALHLAVLRLSDQQPNERLDAATKLFEEFDTYCVKPTNWSPP
jgi:DNA-binding MurR/RpiR family transcriptional regulator